MKKNVTKHKETLHRKKLLAELVAFNPNISSAKIAKDLGIHLNTVLNYKADPKVIDMIYDRFMEVAGIHLPEILLAQIEEAKRGNTKAAELILKNFCKLQDTLVLKVESPFMKHIKSFDTEDAELVTDIVAIDFGESFEGKVQDKLPPLPERDPSNDHPKARTRKYNKSLNDKYSDVKKKNSANIRKKLRNRAKKVGLKTLPPGRHSPEVRRKWLNELLEKETALLREE